MKINSSAITNPLVPVMKSVGEMNSSISKPVNTSHEFVNTPYSLAHKAGMIESNASGR